MYAEPAFQALKEALAREGKVPRSLRSKGRTTLRLRVTEETRRTYRWLERLYARYRPSNMSFLAYCCAELLGVWAHARPPVAYESVYARDGFRCANYRQEIFIQGRPQTTAGRACQQPDGTWTIVS